MNTERLDVEAMWLSYARTEGVAFDSSARRGSEWVECRRAFYAGVLSLLSAQSDLIKEGDPQKAADWLEGRFADCLSFWSLQRRVDEIDRREGGDA